MKKIISILVLLTVSSCSFFKKSSPGPLDITEVNPNKMTALTKKHLIKLTRTYDLTPFLYSREVKIESYVTPRSHPVITLNTRSASSPEKILSKLLHEEFHWWAVANPEKTDAAIAELKEKFPRIHGYDEILINKSTYLHLGICWLEYKALEKYIGEEKAKAVITDIMKVDKVYPRIYAMVLRKQSEIGAILQKNSLVPPALKGNI